MDFSFLPAPPPTPFLSAFTEACTLELQFTDHKSLDCLPYSILKMPSSVEILQMFFYLMWVCTCVNRYVWWSGKTCAEFWKTAKKKKKKGQNRVLTNIEVVLHNDILSDIRTTFKKKA